MNKIGKPLANVIKNRPEINIRHISGNTFKINKEMYDFVGTCKLPSMTRGKENTELTKHKLC